MQNLYISNNGGNIKTGTIDAPFSTLEEARDYIRKNSFDDDITIYLREGRYFFSKSFILTSADSARGEHKITYAAYDNEQVIFDGGIVLNTDKAKKVTDKKILDRIIDKNAREHICQIDISDLMINLHSLGSRGFGRAFIPAPNEFFINSKPCTIARYPKTGEPLIPLTKVVEAGSAPIHEDYSMKPGTIKCDTDRILLWKDAKDACISGLFNTSYADDTIEIEKIDAANRTITTKLPHSFGFRADTYTSWFITNLMEEISAPNDYYIDTQNKIIYFYPDGEIENSLFQLSVLDTPMIMLMGANNICFKGITFENSRLSAVYIEGGNGCEISDCTIHNIGMLAVQIGQGATALPEGMYSPNGAWSPDTEGLKSASGIMGSFASMLYKYAAWDNNAGTNHTIDHCHIYDIGTGGILLGGGNRKKLIPGCNTVSNCRIHSVNRLERTYKPGINIIGVGNNIRNCDIYDMPGFAIALHGNNHKIEYNKIHNVVNEVADAGAIYLGRDISEVGNEINYNFIYDLSCNINSNAGICAIYFDDYSCFNSVYGNFFYNIVQNCDMAFGTVFWNRGGLTSVGNNIFINCTSALPSFLYGKTGPYEKLHTDGLIKTRSLTSDESDLCGVDITSESYRIQYPYLYELYNDTLENQFMYWNNLIVNNHFDGFVNPEELDFTIKPDYERFKLFECVHVNDFIKGMKNDGRKFEIIDFKKIGIQN